MSKRALIFGSCVWLILLTSIGVRAQTPATQPAASQPTAEPADAFDPAEHATGDWFGVRKDLASRGISINSSLIFDYSKNFTGGLDTSGESFRHRFDLGIEVDAEKLLGLHGGKFAAVFQLQHGPNAQRTLTGDVQNFSSNTDSDGRAQLGQIWYEQKFLNDTMRLRAGKLDGNSDFDVMPNAQEFLNNSFSTSATLGLMPSFPETGMGIQLFYEPAGGFCAGVGVFDGSLAHGVHLGELGPKTFFDRPDNLFLIAEAGQRYELTSAGGKLPGKIGVGGWWSTDKFDRLDGDDRHTGTGGIYLLLDQLLWKPSRQRPVPAENATEISRLTAPAEEYPGGIAASASVGWCDPRVNLIDANVLGALTWTGPLPGRPIDVAGLGATWAHLSGDAGTRKPYELAIETFYRVRLTQFLSLKPDLQYIIHPSGGGTRAQSRIGDAVVFTLRLEMTF